MKRILFFGAVMFATNFLSAKDLKLGTMAPDFSLMDENGKSHTFTYY